MKDAKRVKEKYLEKKLPPCHCVHTSSIRAAYYILSMETT